MKRLLFFSTLLIFSFIELLAQNSLLEKKYSLIYNSTSIEQILTDLESDQLTFTYSPEAFDVKRRINLNVQNERLDVILKQILIDQNPELMVINNQVIIRKKRKQVESKVQQPEEKEEQKKPLTFREKSAETQRSVTRDSSTSKSSNINNKTNEQFEKRNNVAEEEETTEESSISIDKTVEEELTKSIALPKPKPLRKASAKPYELRRSHLMPNLEFSLLQSTNTQLSDTLDSKPLKRKRIRIGKPEFVVAERGPRIAAGSYVSMTQLDKDLGILIGGRLQYNFTPKVAVGIAGSGFISPTYNDTVLSDKYRVVGGYGGLFVEYSPAYKKYLHLNYHLFVAGGGVHYSRELGLQGNPIPRFEDSEALFVLEPGVTLEYIFLKWFRAGLDLTYRLSSNGRLNYLNTGETILKTNTLRGFNLGIYLKFGRF